MRTSGRFVRALFLRFDFPIGWMLLVFLWIIRSKKSFNFVPLNKEEPKLVTQRVKKSISFTITLLCEGKHFQSEVTRVLFMSLRLNVLSVIQVTQMGKIWDFCQYTVLRLTSSLIQDRLESVGNEVLSNLHFYALWKLVHRSSNGLVFLGTEPTLLERLCLLQLTRLFPFHPF